MRSIEEAAPGILTTWNPRDSGRVARMHTPDGVRHPYARPSVEREGRRDIAEAVQAIFDAFPDSRLDVRAVIGAGTDHPSPLPDRISIAGIP